MTAGLFSGGSRRGFMLSLAAGCLMGRWAHVPFKSLDDACVRKMAPWAG